MPKLPVSSRSINQDQLAGLRDQGCDSDVLLARLDLVADEGMRKDLAKLKGQSRVYPEILPTQASLRWSTKNPNLGGFVREFWSQHSEIIKPDPGEWWLEWDWSGIEARIFTAYTGDEEDVRWFTGDYDIHTETCKKYLFEWATLPPDWKGKDDERRIRAKNFRYGVLQYGTDERAILSMPGIESLGLDRQVLVQRARRFLQARPRAQAWKAQTWQECTTSPYVVRTFMGHRRYLFGDDKTKRKEGTAHKISGSVANMMAWCLIKIVRVWPQMSLILNKHDGAILAFPIPVGGSEAGSTAPSPSDWGAVREVVEREWEVGSGIRMKFPATWRVRVQ